MTKFIKILLMCSALLFLASCDEEDAFPEIQLNIPNKDSIPVILSNTFEREFFDGESFLVEVPGPWFFLNYSITNDGVDELVVVIIKIKITSFAGDTNFEIFFVNNATQEPTVLNIPSGTSIPAAGGFRSSTVFAITGEEIADDVDFDSLIGSFYTMEAQLIGYTIDDEGIAKNNVIKRVQMIGNAN